MRQFFFILLWVPITALAQSYDASPILFMNTAPSAAHAAHIEPSAGSAPAATNNEKPTASATTFSTALPLVPPLPPNFPEWAVSNAPQNNIRNSAVDSPASPVSTPSAAPEKPPVTPSAPPSPPSPISKLWPRDTVPIFLKSCVGFHAELIPACTCVISELMSSMAHDEFLKLSETDAIESDARVKRARLNCVAAPARKD